MKIEAKIVEHFETRKLTLFINKSTFNSQLLEKLAQVSFPQNIDLVLACANRSVNHLMCFTRL